MNRKRSGLRSRSARALVALLPVVGACADPSRAPIDSLADRTRETAPIRAILKRQVRAWNAGNLEEFMRGYWRSPRLVFFSDAKVTRGWQETLDRYRTKYPDRAAMGRLSFEDLAFEPVRPGLVAVAGIWRLERETPAAGRFLLIFERRDGGWVIVVDSTTSAL